jgi:hypothetical protein
MFGLCDTRSSPALFHNGSLHQRFPDVRQRRYLRFFRKPPGEHPKSSARLPTSCRLGQRNDQAAAAHGAPQTAKAAARQRHTSLEASPWQFEAMDHRRAQLRWQHPISGDNQIATFDSSLDIVLINALGAPRRLIPRVRSPRHRLVAPKLAPSSSNAAAGKAVCTAARREQAPRRLRTTSRGYVLACDRISPRSRRWTQTARSPPSARITHFLAASRCGLSPTR